MKLHHLGSLLTLGLWVFWLVPLQGKKLAPNIFGTSAIQWTSAVIVAVGIPIIFLMGLKLLSGQEKRKAGLAIAFFACVPLTYNLRSYGIFGSLLARFQLVIQSGHQRDSEMISTLTDRALNEETADSRAESAGLLYGYFGVQTVWKNTEGELERFYPTVEQQERWENTVDSSRIEAATTEMIELQLKQMPWLFGLNLGCFTLITFGGLTWRAYRPIGEQTKSSAPTKPQSAW